MGIPRVQGETKQRNRGGKEREKESDADEARMYKGMAWKIGEEDRVFMI